MKHCRTSVTRRTILFVTCKPSSRSFRAPSRLPCFNSVRPSFHAFSRCLSEIFFHLVKRLAAMIRIAQNPYRCAICKDFLLHANGLPWKTIIGVTSWERSSFTRSRKASTYLSTKKEKYSVSWRVKTIVERRCKKLIRRCKRNVMARETDERHVQLGLVISCQFHSVLWSTLPQPSTAVHNQGLSSILLDVERLMYRLDVLNQVGGTHAVYAIVETTITDGKKAEEKGEEWWTGQQKFGCTVLRSTTQQSVGVAAFVMLDSTEFVSFFVVAAR